MEVRLIIVGGGTLNTESRNQRNDSGLADRSTGLLPNVGQDTSNMKFCQTCGAQIHKQAVVCPKCGVPCGPMDVMGNQSEGAQAADAAFILGIVGLCLFGIALLFGSFLGILGFVMEIGGVACGVIGRNKALDAKDAGCWNGKAHAGYIMCRIVTIAMGIILIISCIVEVLFGSLLSFLF